MKKPLPACFKCLLAGFLLPALLCLASAAQSRPGATQAMPPSAYKLISVKVTGTKRFTSDEVAAASGLPMGTVAHEDDFRKAARQLGESGAFSNIAFTYTYSGAGTKLEFQVTDADRFVPVRFTDFVWFSDQELLRRLHDRIPLFRGELPTSGHLIDEVSDVLQAFLVEMAIPGRVEYQKKTDKSEKKEPVQAIEYNVAGVSIRIRQVEFPGASGVELAALQTAAERLTDREYSREFMDSFIESALLPAYYQQGYLKAACGPPQPKVVKPSESESTPDRQPPTFVEVAFPVTPGKQYKLSAVEWTGNKQFPIDTLQPLVHARTGQPANTVQLKDDLRAVQELYSSRGYILASVKVEAQFDDPAGTVALRLAVDEGAVYHMGELEFRGIDNNLTARLRAAWKIRPGDVYDATYLKQYLPLARKLLPASLDWEVEPHVTAITRDKTVDVDLQYTAKATR